MPPVAVGDLVHVHQDEHVGDPEVGVPAGLTTDAGTQAQIGLESSCGMIVLSDFAFR